MQINNLGEKDEKGSDCISFSICYHSIFGLESTLSKQLRFRCSTYGADHEVGSHPIEKAAKCGTGKCGNSTKAPKSKCGIINPWTIYKDYIYSFDDYHDSCY